MIEKLEHYSMTNPASIYDEEALTALELAGRTAAKVNECIDHVGRAEEKIEAIPETVDAAIEQNINAGKFDKAIDIYAGELEKRVNTILGGLPVNPTTLDAEVLDIRVGENGKKYANAGEAVRGQFGEVNKKFEEIFGSSANVYDAEAQTPRTISPYYHTVNGEPEPTGAYDDRWHCSAPIPVKPNTKYTIGLVPAINGIVKPWGDAAYGVHLFHNVGGVDYCYTYTGAQTFTTDATASYIRINYYIGGGVTLDELNARCVLVEGETLPESYIGKYGISPNDYTDKKVAEVAQSAGGSIRAHLENGRLFVSTKYNDESDLSVEFGRHGSNSLPDFVTFATVPTDKTSSVPNKPHVNRVVHIPDATDWFSPYADEFGTFRGGCHDINNTNNFAGETARNVSLKYYINGAPVTRFDGFCSCIKIIWVNEIYMVNMETGKNNDLPSIREKHVMTFDGDKWDVEVEITPASSMAGNFLITKWYGLQIYGLNSAFNKVYFYGGDSISRNSIYWKNASASGTTIPYKTSGIIAKGEKHVAEVFIDTSLGLPSSHGDCNGLIWGDKAYIRVIDENSSIALMDNQMYMLRGYYKFYPTEV